MRPLPVQARRIYGLPIAKADLSPDGLLIGITAPAGRFLVVDVHQIVNGASRPDVVVIPGLSWRLELCEADGKNPKTLPIQASSDDLTWTSPSGIPLVRGVVVEPEKRVQLRAVVNLADLPADITTIAGGFSGYEVNEAIDLTLLIPLLGR